MTDERMASIEAKLDAVIAGKQQYTTMSVKEAADFLKVNDKTLYKWIQSGEVPCHKIGGHYYLVQEELIASSAYSA